MMTSSAPEPRESQDADDITRLVSRFPAAVVPARTATG